jgi:hypothetical protein
LGLAAPVPADTVTLKDGDRVSGKMVARGTKRIRLQTAYGLLIIPLEKIQKIVKDDGSEEVMVAASPPGPAAPAPPPPPPVVKLTLVVTGNTFWQAWDPKTPPPDPSLRLAVRLDESAVASFVDNQIDEGEIPGALVNAFSFAPEAVTALAGAATKVLLPDSRPGRVALEMELPAERAGQHDLRLAYEVNDGTKADPAWREVTAASLDVTLDQAAPLLVRLDQDMGKLEFRKKQMKKVETVRLSARLE